MEKTGCELKWANGRLTALVRGEVDHHSAKGLREEIDHAMYLYRPETLALDLSAVDFMDSSGLGLIMGRYALMQKIGGELILSAPNERVLKILRLAGLERIIKIEEGKENEKSDS